MENEHFSYNPDSSGTKKPQHKKEIIYNEVTIKTLTVCLPPQQIIQDLPKNMKVLKMKSIPKQKLLPINNAVIMKFFKK